MVEQNDVFFVTGGPVRFDSSAYITRGIEPDIFADVRGKKYVTIVGSRQIGKTSLMQRIQAVVEKQYNYATAWVDLSTINYKEISWSAWAAAFSDRLIEQLRPFFDGEVRIEPPATANEFKQYLIALARQIAVPSILILLDEASAIPAQISDPVYSNIRWILNDRTALRRDQVLLRYNFAFAGVFEPERLIQEKLNSPFNVSQVYYLPDFSEAELGQLLSLLGRIRPTAIPAEFVSAAYQLTGGHPYLSQRLANLIARQLEKRGELQLTPALVDELNPRLVSEAEDNINYVVKRALETDTQRSLILRLLVGEDIEFTRAEPSVARLELIGAIKEGEGRRVALRNRLYASVLQKALGLHAPGIPGTDRIAAAPAGSTESGHRGQQKAAGISATHTASDANVPTYTRLLHISDIHRSPLASTSNTVLLGKLLDDIHYSYTDDNKRLKEAEPHLGVPDIIIVSGDFTQRAEKKEFDQALQFLEGLLPLVNQDRRRVVLVPGNHDVNWKVAAQSYVAATEAEFQDQPTPGEPYRQSVKRAPDGTYWRKKETTYTARFRFFKEFHDAFYQDAYRYALNRDDMFTVYDLSKPYGLIIVGYNSCDEIDAYPGSNGPANLDRRAFINTNGIHRAEQSADFHAREQGLIRIAVFHHNIRSVEHGEDFLDPKYLRIIKRHGFDLCLHGHVHVASRDVFDPLQANILPVVGAGSLAAPYADRPPAAPMSYNLLVINRGTGGIWVHTRRHDENNLIWAPDYQWEGKPYFVVRESGHLPRSD